MAEPMGSPLGSGNPPGQYSDSYLNPQEGSAPSHFNEASSYRGSMNVGIPKSETIVGNQPQEDKESDILSRSNKTASY
jgi:hypothetical protein